MNFVYQITKQCFGRKLNILTAPAHERFQSNWKSLPFQFWLVHCPNGKTWEEKYAKLPTNHILIPRERGVTIPAEIDIDLIISHNKFDNYQSLAPIAKRFNIPLICVEHTCPMPNWSKQQIEYMKNQMRGDKTVFITDWSREAWGWRKDECVVIYHGIDTDIFKPLPEVIKEDYILTTVNEYSKPQRHWCCGFPIWEKFVPKNFKWKNLGLDVGFSEPAKSIEDLVFHHNQAAVFLNTSTFSPIPMSVMEAMACGSCVVSLNNCEIPRFIQHMENGLLGNSVEELKDLCDLALKNPELRQKLGIKARKTIVEKYSLRTFEDSWYKLLCGKNLK